MTKEQKNKAFAMINRPEGFTLIELLVVIAIIVILAAALFLVINPAELMKKSRDARRISELGELNKAFAAAIANQDVSSGTGWTSASGDSCTASASASNVDGTGWFTGFSGTLKAFIPRLPKDPTNSGSYCYTSRTHTDGTWEVRGILESANNSSTMAFDGGDDPGYYEVGTSLGLL